MVSGEFYLVLGGLLLLSAALMGLSVEERYGSTPFPERRLRLWGFITLWQWNA